MYKTDDELKIIDSDWCDGFWKYEFQGNHAVQIYLIFLFLMVWDVDLRDSSICSYS